MLAIEQQAVKAMRSSTRMPMQARKAAVSAFPTIARCASAAATLSARALARRGRLLLHDLECNLDAPGIDNRQIISSRTRISSDHYRLTLLT